MHNNVNRIALGTVQFGLDYGINNKQGKPSKSQTFKMLEFAYEKNVRVFDTAFAYGNAEELLGEFIFYNGIEKEVNIISKLKPNVFDNSNEEKQMIIVSEFHKSLERLKVSKLDGYLLHTPEYVYDNKVIAALQNCKKERIVNNIGVSTYNEPEAVYAVEKTNIDYIQIPYNIFDQRLHKTDFFSIAKKNNVKIYARSPFLQGLFFMKPEEVPPNLAEAKKYLEKLDVIIKKYNISRAEISLMYSFLNKDFDYVVFGVDSLEQLKENIEIVSNIDENAEWYAEVQRSFVDIEKHLILPSLWAKKK